MTRVLITGANGFLGSALTRHCVAEGYEVHAAVREKSRGKDMPAEATVHSVGAIDAGTDWAAALDEVEVVFHLAARVHQMNERPEDAEERHREVNTEGTRRLASQASESGVRRVVFASSIKAMGERTEPGRAFRADTPCAPLDAYGRSKRAAEEALAEVCADSATDWTVLRLPLSYGPGVRANFLRLLEGVAKGLPMPLAIDNNRRSLLGVRNFCSAAIAAAGPGGAGKVFLPSDLPPVSTSELIRAMATALEVRPRSLPLPGFLLRALLGRRLGASLEIDCLAMQESLNWRPPFTLAEELAEVVAWWKSTQEAKK